MKIGKGEIIFFNFIILFLLILTNSISDYRKVNIAEIEAIIILSPSLVIFL
jgi:hypothetical protein